jgi:hypothetical protein
MNSETLTNQTDEQHSSLPNPAAGSWAIRARQSLRRFDRYTLEVMNPGHPYRLSRDRSA